MYASLTHFVITSVCDRVVSCSGEGVRVKVCKCSVRAAALPVGAVVGDGDPSPSQSVVRVPWFRLRPTLCGRSKKMCGVIQKNNIIYIYIIYI